MMTCIVCVSAMFIWLNKEFSISSLYFPKRYAGWLSWQMLAWSWIKMPGGSSRLTGAKLSSRQAELTELR